MGQSGYAENFVNLMLGWIRQLASAIAGLFQSNGSAHSSGNLLLGWFSDNWVALLIALIVIGVVVDWLVWMLRWRPYWAWFRKRRIILDDDIDEELTEDELLDRYDMARDMEPSPPRFHSRALRREDDLPEEDEDDDEGYEAYVEDEPDYDGEYEDGFYAEDIDEPPEEDFYEDDLPIEEEAPEDMPDDEWDDIPSKKEKKRPLFGRKRREEEEDPFSVDEEAFKALDDDFFEVVSEEPHPEADEDLRVYARPKDEVRMLPLEADGGSGEFDERIGYGGAGPLKGTASSRKSRRRRQEEQHD